MTFLALTGAYVAFWLYVFWPRLRFAMFEDPYSGYGLDTLLQPAIPIGVGLAAAVLLPMSSGRRRSRLYQVVVSALAVAVVVAVIVLAPPAFDPSCCPT